MIEFGCPHCGQGVEVDDQFAGRKGQCPECGQVIVIPASSSAGVGATTGGAGVGATTGGAGVGGAASSAGGAGAPPVHGPRTMKVPESVRSIDPEATSPQAGSAPTGPHAASALTGNLSLILAFLPCLSVLGVIFGGICWSRASKGGEVRRRRVAVAATLLGAVWTVAQAFLGVALFVAAATAGYADSQSERCRDVLRYVGSTLVSQVGSSGGATLPARITGTGYMYYGDSCPATERRYGYVGSQTYDPTSRTILVYDASPAHGYKTWLSERGDGRNVYRMDGTVEFLGEEAFQSEMAAQAAALGHGWDGVD